MGTARLTLRLDPLRLLCSASLWRSAGYLFSYLLAGGVLFSIALAAGVTTAVLALTVAALPLLVGSAWTVRGCAGFARLMLRQVRAEPAAGGYADPPVTGLMRRARMLWGSGATWRDLAYLVGLFPFLVTLAAAVLIVWVALIGGITSPLWYSHATNVCFGTCGGTQHVPGIMFGTYPHGPHGPGASGFYVDSVHTALLLAAASAAAFLLFNYALVAAAQLHGWVTAAVLRHPPDPLAPVKEVLTVPGPLGPLLKPGAPAGQ